LEVSAFDISVEGENKALQLAQAENVSIDYHVGDFLKMDFPENHFDAAALIYAHFPLHFLADYHRRIARLIKPHGLVILEGFSKNNLPLRAKNPGIGGPD
jgi:ubiquinone/menaquinone biosynthesis C-methylase UbiE